MDWSNLFYSAIDRTFIFLSSRLLALWNSLKNAKFYINIYINKIYFTLHLILANKVVHLEMLG